MSPEGRANSGQAGADWSRWRPTAWRWLLAAVVAVAAPKCFVCVAGYVVLLTGLGWAGPELCGGTTGQDFLTGIEVIASVVLAAAGLSAVLLAKVGGCRVRRRKRLSGMARETAVAEGGGDPMVEFR